MKTRLLLFFLLAVSVKLLGQTGFEENIVVGVSYTTNSPQLVKAVDIDADGDLDVLTYGRGLNWYENIDGLGNFGQKHILSAESNSSLGYSLHAVDFDNDGDPDVLGSMGNRLILYENTDGLGNYTVMQTYTLGISSYPIPAVPVDIDADGDLDVLCLYTTNSGPFQAKLIWYENDGAGNFATEQIISNSNIALFITRMLFTEDLDGDNREDIILGYTDNDKIAWMKNLDGNGTFSAPVTITVLADGLTSVSASDIDNDGDMDIVSTSSADNQVAWYTNLDGLGNFSDENVIISNATATNGFFVADINDDNTKDIIYTKTNEIGWVSNTTGLGNFGNQQTITTKALGVRSVITADLDGDGRNDLISVSQDDNKVAWYKNIDGNGAFGRQQNISRTIKAPDEVYSGDFDGDDDTDLLICSWIDGKLAWYENVDGLGFYGQERIINESASVSTLLAAYPVDIDGDGDLDIAVVKNSTLTWYRNDGHGNFTVAYTIQGGTLATIIRGQDIDGDGDMDLVCGAFSSDKISWFKNNGGGIYGAEQIITDTQDDNGSLTSLEVADIDGDNDMDVIGSSDGHIFYYKNTNGLGSFETELQPAFWGGMHAVYPADIDSDGDKDIIAVNALGGGGFEAVVWYENNGQGNFIVKHDISTLTIHGQSIRAADIDHDGDMDVLTAAGHSQTSGQLAWYENTDGHGHFSARQMIHELFNNNIAMYVNVADVDQDNDMDVLAVFGTDLGSSVAKVCVFENLGLLANTIHGKVLVDSDANGCSDDDIKGRNLMVVSDNGSHSFATFTDASGMYHIAVHEGNFTSSITSHLPDYFIVNPVSHNVNFSGINNTYEGDFCLATTDQINDVSIDVYPSTNNVRPGWSTTYHLVYRNTGTTISSGTINFEYNGNKLNFLTASQPVVAQTANTLTFDFTDLNPFEIRTIDLSFLVFAPPVTNNDDEIISTATINALAEDETEQDNSFTLNQIAAGSYDPNDMICLEGSRVLIEDTDKYLHYLVHFQNTGTASAINIKIENTLDNKLDWTSMQLESLSHNGRVEIKDGREIKFIFNNINLPASITDEPNSHGFIAYKIRPLDNVVAGDIVNNTADIFFDFNPPITTNTASTEFVETLSVAETDAGQFSIYPNPTNSLLNIRGNTMINNIAVADINGRILKEFNFDVPTLLAQIDLTDLTNGIYFLKIKSNQGKTTKKIIKR